MEPPSRPKYTEDPADAPDGVFQRTYRVANQPAVGFRSFGGSFVERLPCYNADGESILAGSRDEVMLFMHLRTTSAGLTRLIAVSNPQFNGHDLVLHCDQIALLNGDYRILRGEPIHLDMTGICGPGEIRVFAGQPDPGDSSRFSIAFVADGRRGWIDCKFRPRPAFSKDPENAAIERRENSLIAFNLRKAAPERTSHAP